MARLRVTTGSVPVFSLQPSRAPYTMLSASDRLPRSRILFTSWVTSRELYTGSGASGRRGAGPLRGMSALLLLRAVATARLLTVADALSVQGTANDLVADAGEVLHPTATYEHDRVLLQVVTDAGDIRGDLDLAGEADAGDLSQRRVRLLRRGRVDARADTPTLRATLERRRLGLTRLRLTALADELLNRRHPPRVSLSPPPPVRAAVVFLVKLCDGRHGRSRPPTPAVGRVARPTDRRLLPCRVENAPAST